LHCMLEVMWLLRPLLLLLLLLHVLCCAHHGYCVGVQVGNKWAHTCCCGCCHCCRLLPNSLYCMLVLVLQLGVCGSSIGGSEGSCLCLPQCGTLRCAVTQHTWQTDRQQHFHVNGAISGAALQAAQPYMQGSQGGGAADMLCAAACNASCKASAQQSTHAHVA
jgi:hypothetical protein